MPVNRAAQEVFDLVVDLTDSERVKKLEQLCGHDSELRSEVESLLKANDDAGEFLLNPTLGASEGNPGPREPGQVETQLSTTEVAEGVGQVVDRYKLLEKIGEGGFGVVYMAQQNEPVRRKVALKIIKLGMDTKQVVARFEAERQALAVMDHPNIARVIDGGSTDKGRPYFVMDLVKGVPIIEYCDQNRLALRSRLMLFQQVCRAISHAHQKGIIHRDIKPSNVLVTVADDQPLVKVIDFGIAKATTTALTDKTLFTEFRQLLGTPLYMSPEQAQRSGVDVDTRTDIYSLGVLLYEMLTGRTPIDPKKLNSAEWAVWQRMIVEDEPSRPSIMVSSSQDIDLVEVARCRGVEAAKLGTLLRGDLDWIVLKSIDKDRSRRYGTVAAFDDDIERFLNGDAVLATPPSRAYRMKKFVARNRAWLGTAAAFLLMLVVGLIATTVTATWAVQSEKQARKILLVAKANERRARRAVTLASASQTLPEADARALSESWLSDIEAMPSRSNADLEQREIEKAQHTVWFTSWLVRNAHDREAADLIDSGFAHAKKWLGVENPSFLELCNARVVLLERHEPDSTECVNAYQDLIESLRQIRGNAGAAVLLPQLAAAFVNANRIEDAKAAVDEFIALVAEHQIPISADLNARLDGAIDRIMNSGVPTSQQGVDALLSALQSIRETGTLAGVDALADQELAADLELLQGRWRYKGWERGDLVEHMVVTFDGLQSETLFLDEQGGTLRGRKSRIELSRSGGVKVFKSFQGAAPDVGGAFIYEVGQHRLTLVSGLLQNETSLPEIKLRHFYRMKPGETNAGEN